MKKVQIILYVICMIGFYSVAIYFYIDKNIAAGIMGTLAGTLMLVAAVAMHTIKK